MTSRAHAEFDPRFMGVRVGVTRGDQGYLTWTQPTLVPVGEPGRMFGDDAWLHLREDDARAIYEALAEHFGHAGHDARALRKDYDAERKRVDTLIGHLIGSS